MATAQSLESWELDEGRFIQLLTALIGEVEFLQNNPPTYVPKESRAARHAMEVLKEYSTGDNPVLKVKLVEYKENRGNLIIEYNSECTQGVVSFVGSHLDVVPANPDTWDRNPFKLSQEGDKLYARGTTDCLGHVALITELFRQLAEKKPVLSVRVVAVFIASEENSSIPCVGIDQLVKEGLLENLKSGPVFWVDSSDSHPCIGCCSALMWKLRAEGRLSHSGLPWNGINALELATAACKDLIKHFYNKYPKHELEEKYRFLGPSTMKETQVKCMEGSVNQIPASCELAGDIRLVPFYDHHKCKQEILDRAQYLNEHIEELQSHEQSKFIITLGSGEVVRGKLKLEFDTADLGGIACKLDSPGYKALYDATKKVLGSAEPYSVGGSLPLVGTMQAEG
ncbi:Acetylornithine deacetylase-like [Oopsacas minuta]|uniref:Acetylornithine deacetylase-like n=1 Tax=Oopsacas minuta TaxID=111878 RepID=A0AAV7K5D0_9METZ|nr:Acetylornithine deacetylase-like [Oopsacas minuta]